MKILFYLVVGVWQHAEERQLKFYFIVFFIIMFYSCGMHQS